MKGRYGMGWGTDQGIASLADRKPTPVEILAIRP